MKNKIKVGVLGELPGLTRKIRVHLRSMGYDPFESAPSDVGIPVRAEVIIGTMPYNRKKNDKFGAEDLKELSQLVASIKTGLRQFIFVSLAATHRPQAMVSDIGSFNLRAENLIKESGLNYTIIRAVKTDDRAGHHHKIYWKQDFQKGQKGDEHPVSWADLSDVICHAVSRPEVFFKTFAVHAVAGKPVEDWDNWFKGLNRDSTVKETNKKIA